MPTRQGEFGFVQPRREDVSPPGSDPAACPPDPRSEPVAIRPLSEALELPPVRAGSPALSALDTIRRAYVERGHFAGVFNIARRLKQSGALDGAQPMVRRFELPRRKFVPRFQLWNETQLFVERIKDVRFPPRDISSHGPRRADGNLLI